MLDSPETIAACQLFDQAVEDLERAVKPSIENWSEQWKGKLSEEEIKLALKHTDLQNAY